MIMSQLIHFKTKDENFFQVYLLPKVQLQFPFASYFKHSVSLDIFNNSMLFSDFILYVYK